MNNGEIYTRAFTSSDPITKEKIKSIFADELGATVVDHSTSDKIFYVFLGDDRTCGMEITINSTSDIMAMTYNAGWDSSHIRYANTSSIIKMAYAKNENGTILFGFSTGDINADVPLAFAIVQAHHFADDTDKITIAISIITSGYSTTDNQASNDNVCYGENHRQSTHSNAVDSTFIEIAKYAIARYVCDDLFVPVYGGTKTTGEYNIDGKKYIATGKTPAQSSYPYTQLFMLCEQRCRMQSEIIVAVLSLAGTFFGTFSGIKLMSYRIEQLEKKEEK